MAVKRAASSQPEGPNFGDLGFYLEGGSFVLAEGDYALEFRTDIFQPKKQTGESVGDAFLAVVMNAYPLVGGEPLEQVLGMGTKAHLSWQPNASGKGLVPVPGGQASGLQKLSNWGIFLKSLYDSGLPMGIFSNDLSVLDGIHVHTARVPEPDERKQFRSAAATGDAQQQETKKRDNLTCVVTEIKDGGAPWEGGGGIPDANAAPAPAPVKAVNKPNGKVAPDPVATLAAEAPDEEMEALASSAAAQHLNLVPKGCPRLALRTAVFKLVSAKDGAETAHQVVESFFGNDAALDSLLGPMGFTLKGAQVIPIS